MHRSPPIEEEQRNFFWQLRTAWDIAAYDHYPPGSVEEQKAGTRVWADFHRGAKPTLTLSHPLQIATLNAMTEAAGIPHRKGQRDFTIPEKLRDYIGYTLSPQYKERVAKAQ